MPAKKKPTRAVRTTRTAKKKSSNISTSAKLFSGRRFWIIAAVLVVVGTFALFRANAATTLPGGKATWQRFPGDPNPKVTGKSYWGAAIGGNGDPARHEGPANNSLSVRRTFWGNFADGNVVTKAVNTAKSDIAANRLPFISFKTPGWAKVANGSNDNQLDNMLNQLDALEGPVWLVVHHEPEGGASSNGIDDPAGAVGWRDMQKRVRTRMNALKASGKPMDNIAFMPVLMSWTWDSRSNRNPADWWVDGIWDAYIVDSYSEKAGLKHSDVTGWKNFVPWVEQKGLPFGTAEWGLTTADNGRSWVVQSETIYKDDRLANGDVDSSRYCAAVHNGDPTLLKNTTAAQEQTAYDNMNEFWNWGRNNNKDMIVATYFDSCLNSPKGPWRMAKRQLEAFQNILKSDPKVMRINDVTGITPTDPVDPGDTGGGTNTGALSIDITAPKTGDTVSAVKKVTAGPDTNVQEVSFRLDGKWQTTDTSAPFEWDWNTATSNNGEHTITIRARKVGDPGTVYTEKSIKVTVRNVTSTPAPTDLLKPSKPTNVKASLRFDATKFRYVVDTTWSPSTDDVSGVKQYQVVRDFTILGNSPTTNYTDSTALEAGKTYRYSVSAIDGTGKISDPATISIKTSCAFIFCSIQQL